MQKCASKMGVWQKSNSLKKLKGFLTAGGEDFL